MLKTCRAIDLASRLDPPLIPRIGQIVEDLLLKRGGVRKERVVILGTGWGAAAVMGRLDPLRYEIVCVSPRNYFLMTPLLPSVTVGVSSPAIRRRQCAHASIDNTFV